MAEPTRKPEPDLGMIRYFFLAALFPIVHIVMQWLVSLGAAMLATNRAWNHLGIDAPDAAVKAYAGELLGKWSDTVGVLYNFLTLLAVVLGLLLLAGRKSAGWKEAGLSLTEQLHLKPVSFRYGVASVLVGVFAYHAVMLLLFVVSKIAPDLSASYGDAASGLSAQGSLWMNFLSLVIFAPLTEELMYRVLPISQLRYVVPSVAAVLITSVIFGVVHVNPLWAVYAGLNGCMFGFLFCRFGSLFPSLIAHMTFNLIGFLYSLRDVVWLDAVFYLVGGASCFLLAGTLVYIFRKEKTAVTATNAEQ